MIFASLLNNAWEWKSIRMTTLIPYPSRLVLGWIGKRPLHIVIAENMESQETIVITVYEPDSDKWMPGFMRRIP
jgi:hypothetical protein